MLRWLSRVVPGLSIVSLAILLILAFVNTKLLPIPTAGDWTELYPRLTIFQLIFIIISLLIHIDAFMFPLRVSWALYKMEQGVRAVLLRRPLTKSDRGELEYDLINLGYKNTDSVLDQFILPEDDNTREVIHKIIIPNYSEDIDTLRMTLNVLASHPRARKHYEIFLAMEEKEADAVGKAASLTAQFQDYFLAIRTTLHPPNLPGEIAGKGSNISFAAKQAVQWHRRSALSDDDNVILTVIDADTHLAQDYFTEIRRLHHEEPLEANQSFYVCPIIFDRNAGESPLLVRCADLLWCLAGISGIYPGAPISIPTSVYSVPIKMAEAVGGWDGDATAIGEDMHMLLKCFFGTSGKVISKTIYSPASQCNVSADGAGWARYYGSLRARYRQGLRHMWGALDTGFMIRNCFRRAVWLNLRFFSIVHLLWEAHFLPSHLTILLIFSSFYTWLTPATHIHPSLLWMFWFTGLLRALSFVGMNIAFFLYEGYHSVSVNARANDMDRAGLSDIFTFRSWHWSYLLERACFPIAGTIFGSVPAVQAEISHFWTDRLVYRVSKKPTVVKGLTSEV